ncbi:unnamed protein product [Laminaria digitata]
MHNTKSTRLDAAVVCDAGHGRGAPCKFLKPLHLRYSFLSHPLKALTPLGLHSRFGDTLGSKSKQFVPQNGSAVLKRFNNTWGRLLTRSATPYHGLTSKTNEKMLYCKNRLCWVVPQLRSPNNQKCFAQKKNKKKVLLRGTI